MKNQIIIIILIILPFSVFAQRGKRTLPSNINQPSVNVYAPAISGNGETLVYLSDYTAKDFHSMYFSTRKTVSSWNEPVEISQVVNNPKLNYRGGYSLSFDGDQLFVTSRKSGIGGFDLWYAERQGSNWGALKNLGKPVNSTGNEGTASISPDGQLLYFMRCNSMDEQKGASGCKLMVSKKKYGKWDEPEELPSNINTGNSQNPKILADGETLIFSSDMMGGQGELDLFMTKNIGGSWSDPISMDFINSDKNDQFVSVASKGRYMYYSEHNGRHYNIVQLLIPEEFKPKSVMKIQGKVVDAISSEPVNARLTVFDVDLRDRIWNNTLGPKGDFDIVLNEGSNYDLSFTHPDKSYKYYSTVLDLNEIGRRDKETLEVTLMPIEANKTYESPVSFKDFSSEIDDKSTYELRRIVSMLKANPEMEIELLISQTNYLEDTLASNEDMTEVRVDSMFVEKTVPVMADSTSNYAVDSLSVIEQELPADSTLVMPVTYETTTELVLKKTYHNDRTIAQGESIKQHLIEKGIEEDRIFITTSKSKRPTLSSEDSDSERFKDIYVAIKVKKI